MRQRGSASASEVELDDAKEDEALLRKNMSMNQLTKLVESVSAQRDDDWSRAKVYGHERIVMNNNE